MPRALLTAWIASALLVAAAFAAPIAGAATATGGAGDDGALTDRAQRWLDAAGPQGRIVGGGRAAIESVPWQVAVWSAVGDSEINCGGAILGPTTVLTAAHCVRGTSPGADPRHGGIAVWAGVSNAFEATPDDKLQEVRVASVRVHPHWSTGVTATTGDLALLTLAAPLDLGGSAARAIALPAPYVPSLQDAPIPQDLVVSGYGTTRPGAYVDGDLRTLPTRRASPTACPDDERAVALCTITPRGTSCQGDSGGPVAAPGREPVLYGIVSNGPTGCPAGTGDFAVDLTAPENRRWIDGDPAPPWAPRGAGSPRMLAAPGDGGTEITCTAPAITRASAVVTLLEDPSGRELARGTTAARLVAGPELEGTPVSCRAIATSDGGTLVTGTVVQTGTFSSTQRRQSGPGAGEASCAATLRPRVRIGIARTARRGRTTTLRIRLSGLAPTGGERISLRVDRLGSRVRWARGSRSRLGDDLTTEPRAVTSGRRTLRLRLRVPERERTGRRTLRVRVTGRTASGERCWSRTVRVRVQVRS